MPFCLEDFTALDLKGLSKNQHAMKAEEEAWLEESYPYPVGHAFVECVEMRGRGGVNIDIRAGIIRII